MPYYREILLSAWPSHMVFEVGAPPPKTDATLLQSLRKADMGCWVANPKTARRNQALKTRERDHAKNASLAAPKFLSEKAREAAVTPQENRRMSEALEAMADAMLDGTTKKEVPVMYRNVEIKYSKFGVDDFDFEYVRRLQVYTALLTDRNACRYYNRTKFSGLETHIANSYANPLLQLYRFIPSLRNAALVHTASACLYEHCLLCELGFFVDMLEKADGRNCQATNFLKTFSSLPTAASLNLLEEHSPSTPLSSMIQAVNRFLLDKFSSDFSLMQPHNHAFQQLLSTKVMATIRCGHCTHEQMRAEDPFVHELVYPMKNMMRTSPRLSRPTFSQILKQSVERQDQTRGWCPKCRRYQQLSSRKQIQTVPAVLMINTTIMGSEARHLWSQPGWLPHEIGVIVQQGQFFCYEGQDLELHIQRGVYNVQVYQLVGAVADVNSGENQKPHLVSLIDGKSG